MKVIILGHAGAGKTTLARTLMASQPAALLSLDEVAFKSGTERRPLQDSSAEVMRWLAGQQSWIIEGCHAGIIEPLLGHCDELIFLNPGVEACIAHCLSRPWEPEKFASPSCQRQERCGLQDDRPDNPWFRTMDRRRARELVGSGARRTVPAGSVLIRQGEEGKAFHLVLSGQVDAIHATERVSHRLFTFTAGEFLGGLPLLMPVPYPTTMIAPVPTTLFVIPSGSCRALLASHPEFAEQVAAEVARRSDVLRSHQDCLRQRGLLDDTDMRHPLQWFRERLRRVLAGRPAPAPEEMGETGGLS
jgi:CRP-like cAMP-binding protein